MSIAVHDALDVEKRIAQWAAALSLADIPASAQAVARDCIADGIGVMLAGSRTPTFGTVARLPRHAGRCALAGSTAGADVLSAAFLNGVACHIWDFDDTSYAGIVHGTAVVLPAVLAVAQETGASGVRFLEAFVAGVEAEYALGLALTDSLYDRGHWTTTTLGVIGAAVGSAKLLGLSEAGIAEAIRLAANMPIGLRAVHGSNGKPYLCGMAAKLGVEAAYAAKAGIHAQENTFGRRRGFAWTLNGGVLKPEHIEALGRRYTLTDPGIAFKLRPLCSATQAAADAMAFLQTTHGFRADDVESVRCFATELVVSCLTYPAPTLPSEAQFSMQFALACTLLHGDVRPGHLNETVLKDPALVQLMQRISLEADRDFVPADELPRCPEAGGVEVRLRDGRVLEHTVLAAAGMPQNPAGEQRLMQKFLDCASPTLARDAAQALWEAIHRVEELPDVNGLPGLSVSREE